MIKKITTLFLVFGCVASYAMDNTPTSNKTSWVPKLIKEYWERTRLHSLRIALFPRDQYESLYRERLLKIDTAYYYERREEINAAMYMARELNIRQLLPLSIFAARAEGEKIMQILEPTILEVGPRISDHDLGCKEGYGKHCIQFIKELRSYNETSRNLQTLLQLKQRLEK